jgi:uncharacterized phage-associated protein
VNALKDDSLYNPNGYDVRGVANLVLDVADKNGRQVSNLALNKILYFLHSAYLHEFRRPLVSAKIEAWDHGPVFREVYHQFKAFGREPIKGRARRLDLMTGDYTTAVIEVPVAEASFLHAQALELLQIAPGKLVDMSHVRDGPWHQARFNNGVVNPGVEITNESILADVQLRH